MKAVNLKKLWDKYDRKLIKTIGLGIFKSGVKKEIFCNFI